jgi:hypothetical protein
VEDQVNSTSTEGEEQLPAELTAEPKGEGGAVIEPAEGAEETEVREEETPKPRVYSEEEWNKRQSSWDKQFAETQQSYQTQILQFQQQAQERQDQEFLSKVEADGGDVNAAKELVARQKAIREREQELEFRGQSLQAYGQQVYEEGKAIAAHKMASQYGVDEKELLKAQNPMEMENIALKLHAEKLKAGAKRPIKTDSSIPSAKGVDWSKLSPTEKLNRGLEGMDI